MLEQNLSLAQFQQQFAQCLLSPEPPTALADSRWLAVYRNNVMHSLTQALVDQFPVVQRLVGQGFFLQLARDYVRQQLPDEPALTFYGHRFADFIAHRDECRPVPYLADVARLELALQYAMHAEDSQALAATSLLSLPADQLPECRLPLQASASLLQSCWPIERIHTENLKDEPAQLELNNSDTAYLLIYRRGNAVQLVTLQEPAFALLHALQGGCTLQAAWELVCERCELADDELVPLLLYLLQLDVFTQGEEQ